MNKRENNFTKALTYIDLQKLFSITGNQVLQTKHLLFITRLNLKF